MKNYIGGQIVKFNIWRFKREYFKDTDPEVVASRQQLFPDGEPDTDTFVKVLALHVKNRIERKKAGEPEP